jgi:hypothetical protein
MCPPIHKLTYCAILGVSLSAGAADRTMFTGLDPAQTGVDMVNKMNVDHPLSYLYHSGMTCGGVVIDDLNGDGKPDLVFGGGIASSRIYVQSGELTFTDATKSSGLASGGGAEEWVAGVAAGDANGDGKTDLYICRYMQPNQLWLNATGANGALKFTLAPDDCGLSAIDCSHSAAFADYDGDGDLDLYLLTNRIEDPKGTRYDIKELTESNGNSAPNIKKGLEKYYSMWRYDYDNWGVEATGTEDILYRNDSADGVVKFTNVTKEAGIEGRGDGLSVTWWDYNRDGWPDIYVGNDFIGADRLYKNNGNGTFSDVIADAAPHTPWFSMGCDQGDLNNDLLPDILIADMSAASHFKSKTTMGVMGGFDAKRAYYAKPQQQMQNTLLIGTGTGRFSEGARLYGVSSTDWTWSVKIADFDNDGWQDVYFTNGISRHMNDSDITVTRDMLIGKHMFEFWKKGEMRSEMNRAFRNTGKAKLEEVSQDWGLDHTGVSYGAAYADLDRDGDLDLVTVNLEEPNSIWRNDSSGKHWLAIELKGAAGNPRALGAEIVAKSKSGAQLRYLSPQTGYLSCNEPVLHFGLGSDSVVDELIIRWPGKDGGEQVMKDVKADQWLKVERPATLTSPKQPAATAPLFKESQSLAVLKYKDAGWEQDFQRQGLLPHSHSQVGPCMAWGDVNGDGKQDVFFGGSAGEMAQLRLATDSGSFTGKWTEAFRGDRDCEDSDAVFFDADGDGDLDLCVVSGTDEFPADAKEQRARLYLNDGKGEFTPATEFPDIHLFAGCVAAGDFDKDGKTDLFIGARCKAQDWPHSDGSHLLRNVTGAKFEEVSGFENAGLVTGAAWADTDGDTWPELVLSCEWGPIKHFANTKGTLKETTAEAGLAAVTGWWNCVIPADLNGDGKVDLVAGNVGLNTKYKAPDATHPMTTYYGIFDQSGKHQVVEVKREKNELGEILYPERGRSCSSNAMPFIKEKFPTFKEFAMASLTDIYSEEKLEASEKFEANEFQSGAWMNDGSGKFTWQPFVREAQNAPVFDIAAADFTGDGKVDLFFAQNWLNGPQIETPRYDNGIGMLLRNDGKGNLLPVHPLESGISLTGCMKSAAAVDVNSDGKTDIVVGRNSDSMAVLLSQ